MADVINIQGRELRSEDIVLIRDLMTEHKEWNRTRLSRELCHMWNWRNPRGQIKDMAARTLLLKLERRGFIQLPERQGPSANGIRNHDIPQVIHSTELICCALRDLQPLTVSVVRPKSDDLHLFNCLLSKYHYLGHRNTVGENIRYLVRDRLNRPVSCILFGSAAWKCTARDVWIGWDRYTREKNLDLLTNNTRFLVPPWVTVPYLASHVLALAVRRIQGDWNVKYGHSVYAVETFVDSSRFRGTCYKAANWIQLGATQGRTRNDRKHRIRVPIKDIYLYPLIRDIRQELCAPACSRTEVRVDK